jgi:hypothetical protein
MACRITMIRQPTCPRGTGRRLLVLAWLLLATAPATAVEIFPEPKPVVAATPAPNPPAPLDLPPHVVADFTRRMQPLVLNRCASGACHGSPTGPEPRFTRSDPRGGIDHRTTQANLRAFLAALGPEADAAKLAALLAAGHPAKPVNPRLVAAPLSPQERISLERWLVGVRQSGRGPIVDYAVQQVTATVPAHPAPPPAPNRFKALLDTAANPPDFPPPEEPKGVIFPRDAPPAE